MGLGKAKRHPSLRPGEWVQVTAEGQITPILQIKGHVLLMVTDGHRVKHARGFGRATARGGFVLGI